MNRSFLLLIVSLLLAPPLVAQDAEPETDTEATAQDAAADPAPEPEEQAVDFDETGLDEQGFADEDDDFDPSEEIPTDQSIDFPADI